MSKENKRRPPVFQAAEEPEVFKTAPVEEDLDSLLAENNDVEAEEPEEKSAEDEVPTAPEVLANGWRTISLTQQNGKPYLVTSDLNAEGVRAFWRKTRVLDHNKWALYGKWSDVLTRGDVLPEPRYYRELP